jgi:phosphate-selective porin
MLLKYKVWTLIVIPESGKDIGANMTVSVGDNKVTDLAGNNVAISLSKNQAIDTKAPILTTQNSAVFSEASDLTINFNENIKKGIGQLYIRQSSNNDPIATIDIATDTDKFSINNDKLTLDISAL